ncbi:MAG: C39 family peptidase [Coriobacteriia bacterium]|nr:C39 family peptidase [Coriobacteriia bacterium]
MRFKKPTKMLAKTVGSIALMLVIIATWGNAVPSLDDLLSSLPDTLLDELPQNSTLDESDTSPNYYENRPNFFELFPELLPPEEFFVTYTTEAIEQPALPPVQQPLPPVQQTISPVQLDVPLVSQFPLAPTGCEIASLTMLLLYAGYSTTLEQSLDEMWYSNDPNYGFVGDPTGWDGWTIYPECAGLWIAERIGSYQNLSGVSFETLRSVLREGKPIVIWMVHPWVGLHCLCMTGCDQNGFYFNDPYGYKDWFCDYVSFEYYWSWYYYMALSY